MDLELAERAAIVAGRDAADARDAGRPHADPGSLLHRGQIEPVDHDFQDGIDALGQRRSGNPPQRRAEGIVGRGDQRPRSRHADRRRSGRTRSVLRLRTIEPDLRCDDRILI